MARSVADLRQNYTKAGLTKADIAVDPVVQFRTWFDQAVDAELPEPNAMTLATATPDGKPSARIVLLKGFDDRGFVFYTNYNSNKGQQLEANPQAALVFWWEGLERQVRIEGQIVKVEAAESDAYFASRPQGSQLGAWASPQSQAIASRAVLAENLRDLENQYGDRPVPRPPHWGGFRLIPDRIEFWQGRPNRLHDRLNYCRDKAGNWQVERLAP
ncbi:MAG: pyridoxamine 5'-phosphate oxidase [Jaaginema sp. PMC 1079.18]|nr:pyridoxamine 5'-phosphate oxidase [Jaaginema sp. PMC 1080.18]MEC4852013.1 pyridoxamine 5'-phosphate oxidase [Jaaginema sp. PMC 1079.18]MEC4866806.1 pyridoxamine 5'-phosphate oxidase [Jaaginema sp. PMC 1078.18]